MSQGTVVHAPPASEAQYEHSSIIRTVVHQMFKQDKSHPAPTYLTNRDAWAKSFEFLFAMEPTPRRDAPMTATTPVSHRTQYPATLPALDGGMALSDLQVSLVSTIGRSQYFDGGS